MENKHVKIPCCRHRRFWVHCQPYYCATAEQGFAVRTTVRDVAKKRPLIEAMMRQAGVTDLSELSFMQADLTSPDHWDAAINGTSYVIHPASPTPTLNFKDESEMIQPAVNGVLFVLRVAAAHHVKRVVLTSAYGAIFAGHRDQTTPFTEVDWSDLTKLGGPSLSKIEDAV